MSSLDLTSAVNTATTGLIYETPLLPGQFDVMLMAAMMGERSRFPQPDDRAGHGSIGMGSRGCEPLAHVSCQIW